MRVQLNETFYANHSYTHRYDELATYPFQAYSTNETNPKGEALYLVELVDLPTVTFLLTKEEFNVIS